MEHVNNQLIIKLEYQQLFAFKVSKLVEMRKKLRIPQYQLARLAGCSLRKVQLFENHKSLDAFLLYVYKTKFKNQDEQ